MSHIDPVSANLDELYGPLISPLRRGPQGEVQRWEHHFTPSSLSMLDERSAGSLKVAMDETAAGWKLGQVTFYDVLIIWLVDADGEVWFAFEELVVDGHPTGVPKYQRLVLTARMAKLGHPALIRCQPARIAGEIFCDFRQSTPIWIINNNSGRYGRHPSRTAQHLDNVVARFAKHDVVLVPEYVTLDGA